MVIWAVPTELSVLSRLLYPRLKLGATKPVKPTAFFNRRTTGYLLLFCLRCQFNHDRHPNPSKDSEAYFNRAAAKGMSMDVAGSIKDYDKAIEINPNYMEAYANRGVAKINMLTTKGNIQPTKEQTSDGCADLKKAKQLGDKTVDDMIFIYCDKK